jgi:hypothetical protein
MARAGMSAKQDLLERTAVCRLRLHRQMNGLRQSLRGSRVLGAVPPVALGAGVIALGMGRIAHYVAIAGRVLLYARLARSLFGFARGALSARRR